jgi:hypothetical protein
VKDPAGAFRWALIGLAFLAMGGTALDLAMERHWDGFIKLIPWISLGVLLVAALLVAIRPRPAGLWAARVLAVAVVGAAAFGVFEHTEENRTAGPLDYRYSATWSGLPATDQWWKALTKTVGPAPTLAPGVLMQAALCLVAATYKHPALGRRKDSNTV